MHITRKILIFNRQYNNTKYVELPKIQFCDSKANTQLKGNYHPVSFVKNQYSIERKLPSVFVR